MAEDRGREDMAGEGGMLLTLLVMGGGLDMVVMKMDMVGMAGLRKIHLEGAVLVVDMMVVVGMEVVEVL